MFDLPNNNRRIEEVFLKTIWYLKVSEYNSERDN